MLARRFLYAIAALIGIILIAGLCWNLFQTQMMRVAFVPGGAFAAPPGLIDYRDPANWVSRPGLPDDPAHYNPPGVGRPAHPPAAVFFVPPTTYLSRARWNAPLDDADANARLRLVVSADAGVFNGVGEVWAPRYRQATFGAFLTSRQAAFQALDFAYRDVARAWDAFIAEVPPDRPIILAGHSQGSRHLMTLLAQRIAGTPAARRIVAAYVIGWPISLTADLPRLGLPSCARADQAGCILSWQSYAEPADPVLLRGVYDTTRGLTGRPRRGTPMLCVDPLTGTAEGSAPASANLGALTPNAGFTTASLQPGRVPARCDPTGLLLIGAEPEGFGHAVLPGRNFHVFDYALFWANVRADAARRLTAWEKRR